MSEANKINDIMKQLKDDIDELSNWVDSAMDSVKKIVELEKEVKQQSNKRKNAKD